MDREKDMQVAGLLGRIERLEARLTREEVDCFRLRIEAVEAEMLKVKQFCGALLAERDKLREHVDRLVTLTAEYEKASKAITDYWLDPMTRTLEEGDNQGGTP